MTFRFVSPLVAAAAICSGQSTTSGPAGLLFHLDAEHGARAAFSAAGKPEPTFLHDVTQIPDGASGSALRCGHTQLLAYRAPGNIYAQRGTLAFFWRSREPVGPTEFPIFRVGYGDHSSWDMVWLRIDYNGKGFDAFVTDTNLARTRVSVALDKFPAPDEWTHLAFTWDETEGVRLFVNGKLAAEKLAKAIYDAALDQFGPHSRIISPYQVQSAYNFMRGGDIDEVRIYDRALKPEEVVQTAERGSALTAAAKAPAAPNTEQLMEAWSRRYGWNSGAPLYLEAPSTRVRKVEIHDAFDLKRWYWKGNDGIRETTWPAPFNRSRIEGRTDYFILPDWDCYSISGRSVRFTLPDEPWNHIEMIGAAHGKISVRASQQTQAEPVHVVTRPAGVVQTGHRLPSAQRGGSIDFENVEPETPIQEFSVFHVDAGAVPHGSASLNYRIAAGVLPDNANLASLLEYIRGRHPAPEQNVALALPAGAPSTPKPKDSQSFSLPIVHVLIPCEFRGAGNVAGENRFSYTWENLDGGLDGIALQLPPMALKATHGNVVPMNVQVMDPIWPGRAMLDFSFSIKPNEARTLWLDLRDRLLPNGKSLYVKIASADAAFRADMLEGANIRLVFKERAAATREHEQDRFTQLRDSYAMLTEEYPNNRRFDLFNRFEADLTDLLRANPSHTLGRQYNWVANPEHPMPAVTLANPPAGVPVWTQRQVELLGHIQRVVEWYIDHRQIENGEFGGGLSDDGDFTNYWPATALMGAAPEKIKASLLRHMEAYYAQGMFTGGLATIQTDELHSYEEGIQVLSQCLLLDYGNPKHLERAMETTRGVERITGVNKAGHRHIRSSYFGGTRIAEEGVWAWSRPASYLILHPTIMMADYNGAPRAGKLLTELTDGLLAHRRQNSDGEYVTYSAIHFHTDEDAPGRQVSVWPMYWAAWQHTKNPKYLEPLLDPGPNSWDTVNANALDMLKLREKWAEAANRRARVPQDGLSAGQRAGLTAEQHFLWQVTGDKKHLEDLYTRQVQTAAIRHYINTEGSLWIDRVAFPFGEIQRARLGGIALTRNGIYPGHVVSWNFRSPATGTSVAVLIPDATPEQFTVIAYNLENQPVRASMTGGQIEPGTWELTQGVDRNDDDKADGNVTTRQAYWQRGDALEVELPARSATILKLKRVTPDTPYWERPDLGVSADDVSLQGHEIVATVHNVGAIKTGPARLLLVDASGREVARAHVPAMDAPTDLLPKTARVSLRAPKLKTGMRLRVELVDQVREITASNNEVPVNSAGISR